MLNEKNCPNCNSTNIRKNGSNRNGSSRFRCNQCLKTFGLQILLEPKKSARPIKVSLLEKYEANFLYYKKKVNWNKIIEDYNNYKNLINGNLKLEIELIPSSTWGSNIRLLVKASEWDRIRFVTGGLNHFKCEICDERGINHPVECHEIWNYDESKKIQTLLRFQALCPLCHQAKHLGLASILGNYERAVERFKSINFLSNKEAEKLIQAAYSEHKYRSKLKWKLDISLLKSYHITIDNVVLKNYNITIIKENANELGIYSNIDNFNSDDSLKSKASIEFMDKSKPRIEKKKIKDDINNWEL